MPRILTLNEKINLRQNMQRFAVVHCDVGRKLLLRMDVTDLLRLSSACYGYVPFSKLVERVLPAPSQLIV